MAKVKNVDGNTWKPKSNRKKKKTSVGRSRNSRPINKGQKRIQGKHCYRGQGK